MSPRLLQIEVERRLLIINPKLGVDEKLTSDTIFSFINAAIIKFYKTRYSGINSKLESFEETLKRIDDLRTLVVKKTYVDAEITNVDNVCMVDLPNDYVLLLGDTAGIVPADTNDCWDTDSNGNYIPHYSDTIEGTIETVDRIKENSLSEYHLKYTKAKPIRLVSGNKINLHTDGNYRVYEYTIEYLKKPSLLSTKTITTEEYTDLPEHTHIEIVDLAIQLFLSTVPNYEIYSDTVNRME